MKYLEAESTTDIIGDILEIKESIAGLSILLETYSLKMTRKERKKSRSGKYKSMSSMVTDALNLLFFGYEIKVTFRDIKIVSEEECRSDLTNKLFTIGITKNYQEMSGWVDSVFGVIRKCAGEDAKIIRVCIKTGPFEKCHWSECIVAYGKELKRVSLFVVLYASQLNSPIM
ncbi:hypothetical protein NEMIN01_1238 [Nematocida minor]|uniref:uncharacterized protein n=1 Tax=Nematocida minor TaxID=1912983 RepID=UPI0022206A2C|nr:uncharacterized protein NEMIN01_1238 [Nematocida minor]KAI5190836.1 hypothetical protein NEMIN01_1238 [Nematocida minor]